MKPGTWIAILTATGALAVANGAGAVSFNRADTNRDGVVDFQEARRAYPGLSEAQLRRMDINRNGVIDRGEYPQLDAIYQLLIRGP